MGSVCSYTRCLCLKKPFGTYRCRLESGDHLCSCGKYKDTRSCKATLHNCTCRFKNLVCRYHTSAVKNIVVDNTWQEIHCPICLSEFNKKSCKNVKIVACGHVYHSMCIKQWLVRKMCCPLCSCKL